VRVTAVDPVGGPVPVYDCSVVCRVGTRSRCRGVVSAGSHVQLVAERVWEERFIRASWF